MGEITQEALNIMLQDGKTKDNLKQVLSGVLENVASRAVAEVNGAILEKETEERAYYWIESER